MELVELMEELIEESEKSDGFGLRCRIGRIA
jgi:hypothetical protein